MKNRPSLLPLPSLIVMLLVETTSLVCFLHLLFFSTNSDHGITEPFDKMDTYNGHNEETISDNVYDTLLLDPQGNDLLGSFFLQHMTYFSRFLGF